MDTDPIIDALTRQLSELADTRLASLNESADLQTMTRTLLEHEARRIQAKFGENHPRTQQLRTRLDNAKTQVDTLVAERERNQIQIPEVSPENTLVHGIVADKDRRGISGVMVCFTGDNDRPIRSVGEPVTDASGYFGFALSPADIRKLQSEHPNGVFIAVFSGDRNTLIQRQPKPLPLTPKERIFVEIEVDRRRVFDLEPGKPPTGPNTVIVPDVLGQTESMAIATLEEAQLKVGERQSQPVPDSEHVGRVLAQDPQAGARVTAASTVDIVVGTSAVRVPNLLSLNLETATAALEKTNLKVGTQTVEPVRDPDRVGLVIAQEPEAGAAVGQDTTVNLVIGAMSLVQVPELVGLKLASARRKVSRSGLKIGTVTKRSSDQPNVVLEQNPAVDTEVPVDSAVDIVVGEEDRDDS